MPSGIPFFLNAGLLCAFSQVSIPIGAILGVYFSPVSEKVTARWMAFGAGALVFAVAIQLVGQAMFDLQASAKNGCDDACRAHLASLLAQLGCGVIGAFVYVWLDRLLESFTRRYLTTSGPKSQELAMRNLEEAVGGRRESGADSIDEDGAGPTDASAGALAPALAPAAGPPGGSGASSNARALSLRAFASDPYPPQGQMTYEDRRMTEPFRDSEVTVGSAAMLASPIVALAPLRRAASVAGNEASRINSNNGSVASMGEGTFGRKRSVVNEVHIEKNNVAMSMWLGVVLDSVPESLMMALKASENSLEIEFLLAVCIANFPEAFSGASLLKSQGMSNKMALGMWFGAFFVEVALCMAIAAAVPDIKVHEGPSVFCSAAEGLTGGAMLTMIATAMLPEALHGAGPTSGVLFVLGLMLSVFVTAIGTAVNGS